MRDFAVRPDRRPAGRHALRALLVALVVLATTVLGAGFALAAQGDVQCNGVLNGGTPNDPIGKVVASPNDNPATPAIEAYPGDTITYTVAWPPNGAPKATVIDCLVTDPVVNLDGSLASYGNVVADAALATAIVTDASGSLGAIGADLGFEKTVDPNSGTYVYSVVIPAGLLGHTFANRAKVEGTNESKSNFLLVSVVAPPVANVAPVVGCPAMSPNGLTVGYTASATDADGTIANYHWVFGDGSTADTAGNTTSHTYAANGTYNVSVTVTDDDGATGSSSGTCAVTVAALVIPNVAPVVTCPAMVINGLSVAFTANGTDADGTISNYHWVFGDGSTADTAGNSTNHVYAVTGSFPVSVTVTDDDGATGSSSGTCAAAVAAPVIPNVAPSVSCPAMSADELEVDYTASASDSDGTIANYRWIFGDGQTADTATNTTTHTYAAGGTYSVSVTVTDDDGATASSSGTCSVTVAAASTPAGPTPPADDDDPIPTVVLPVRRTLPSTGTQTRVLAWIAAALLFGGALLRGVKPRPVRMVYAGRGLVAQQVAQYGLMLASSGRPVKRFAFRRI